jgi:hypothetical protein
MPNQTSVPTVEPKRFYDCPPELRSPWAGKNFTKGESPWLVYGSKTFADAVAHLRFEARLRSR